MKAELFINGANGSLCDTIRESVRDLIDPSLQLDVIDVQEGKTSAGERYSQLLHASMPPEVGLRLQAASLEWLSHRLYFRVYWPIFRHGYNYTNQIGSIFPERFGALFPAVAMRDRMLLVPVGHVGLLDDTTSYCRVSDEQSQMNIAPFRKEIKEIDFGNRTDIREAIRDSAVKVTAQLRQELLAWSKFQTSAALDLTSASIDLDVQIPILRRLMRDQNDYAQSRTRKLTCSLDQDKIACGHWTKVVLEITNTAGDAIDDVIVDISGPLEVAPNRIITNVRSYSVEKVQVSLHPNESGEFPIEVTLTPACDVFAGYWIPPQYIWLEAT